MSFIINNELSLIDNLQFLSSSLDNLVKNLDKEDFKSLNQEFDNNVLDIVKQKGFYPSEYMSDFENLKENYLGKKNFLWLFNRQKNY